MSIMPEVFIQFLAAASIIIAAGAFLTQFADDIAQKTGLGRVLVGSLFLAGATSLPEITVDLNAIHIGQPDLAVGDLLGSGLFNLLILMGVSATFQLPKESSPRSEQHAIAAVLSIMLTSIIALGLLVNLEISFLRAGWFTWFAFLCYLFGLRLLFQLNAQATCPPETKTFLDENRASLTKAIGGFATCALIILLAAPYLAEAADKLAMLSGLSHSFIGTTLVALSTSLPELVATIAAFRMRCPDLAFGNIFGSNMFNIAIFLPLDWYHAGNLLRDASDINAVSAIGVIFATSITVITLLYAPIQRKFVLLGNGLVIASILAVLLMLYHLRSTL